MPSHASRSDRAARHPSIVSGWRSLLLVPALCLIVSAPTLDAQAPGLASAKAATAADTREAKPEPQARGKRRTTTRSRTRSSARRTRRVAPAAPEPRWTTPRGATALSADLGTMLGSRTRGGQWGAIVVSLTTGDTLYSLNADVALQPASNMKLFTAAVALDQFGPTHQFSTDVLRTGSVGGDGTLRGDLVLRGDGDPGLSSRFIQGGPAAPMNLLAQYVVAAGIRRVEGDLVADASAFDAQRIPDGWQSRYLQAGYAARVSALSLNENLAWVVVSPGATGSSALVRLEPATDIPVYNRTVTRRGGGDRIVVLPRPDGSYEVRGWIGRSAREQRYQVVVEDPAMFTAGAFRRALAQLGVTVTGSVRLATAPQGGERIASLPSQPLSRLLAVMNRESINHYAELLFRDAGRQASGGLGTVETGNVLLQRFMTEKVGAVPGSVYAADGSGLSILDRATPRALVQLLGYGHKAPWADAFHASLPVAGESELLRNRMRFTPAAGNLHAKTGTTNTVISLGGYVTSHDGELLAFAFIYNGADRWNARSTIDQMGATLAGFARN